MDNTQVIHTLIKSFKYTPANAGSEVEAQFVTLCEPSVRQLSACATLKQAFMRVIAKEANSGADTQSGSTTVVEEVPMENRIINALYGSDVDMTVVLQSAKELFREVALVDGEKKMTVPMLDALCIEDMELMTGKYMANFILASVLKAA